MGCATRVGWILGALLALGCQAESPVVGESTEGVSTDSGLDEYFGGTSTIVVERVYGDTCIPHNLSFEDVSGVVPCAVVETSLEATAEACDCPAQLGRGPVAPNVGSAMRRELENAALCNAGGDTPACEDLCMCEISQASGSLQQACETESEYAAGQGFCIVDPAQGHGDPELVDDCPLSRKKLLRLGMTEPAPNTALHLACVPKTADRQEIRDLGEPCLPSVERDPSFPGFTLGTVSVEMQAPGCASEVCLVHNFQGRVSCPYGQTEEQALETPACFVPGTEVAVQTDVAPQLVARSAEQASVCSCRCDGPDPALSYCECPESMECAPLVPDFGLGAGLDGGSYCVPRGSLISETGQGGPVCDATQENCGSASP